MDGKAAQAEPSSMFEKFKSLREARRAVALVWDSAPGLTLLNAALTILLSFLPLVGLLLLRRLLDQISGGGAMQTEPLLWTIGFMGAVALAGAVGRSISTMVGELQSLEVADRMKTILHAKSIEMDLEYYENSEYQDTLRRAQQEAPYRPVRIVNALLQVAQSGLSLVVIGGFLMVTLHWGFLVALLVAALPGLWVRARLAKENFELQRKQTATERAVTYMDLTLTNELFAKEVRLFDLGGFFSRRSQGLRTQLRDERAVLAKRRTMREAVTQVFTAAAVYGSLAFIALRTARGALSLGSLVMYYQALQRGQGYLQDFLAGISNLYENNLFLKNLSEFLDFQPRIVDTKAPKKLPAPARGELVFENVSFSYPGKEAVVLENISFTIPAGRTIALVGENGSGKTTLVKLMCRLYDPTQGRILLDGIDIRELSIADLRKQFSVIFQDFVRYHLPVTQNIALGDIAQLEQRDKIIAAAQRAGADEFIEKLPKGYDSNLGRMFGEGEELSGGQWQKIALARAFLRESPFIIMDEPTSAMDPRAEYQLFKRLAEMATGRTAVLISHRLSTVRMADTILFLEGGKITDRGNHEELVARGGSYARLFEMQAKNYR